MTDRLVEIQRADLSALKKHYEPDGSAKSYIGYTALENYIRWLDYPDESETIKFFCLNGDFSDGTFVVTVSSYKM